MVLAVALAGCGGGGGEATSSQSPAASCDVATQKSWLRTYMQQSYFWTGIAPNPEPTAYATLQDYFDAQLYTGSSTVPKDRWSYISDTASYNQFFEEGKTLGYGLAVNGLEAKLPLKIRYIEPNSPAAAAGLLRGDVIKSINGVSDQALFTSGNFGALSPAVPGDIVSIVIDGNTGQRTVPLVAATYALKPVSASSVLSMPNGAKAGYVMLKDFISQSEAPMAAVFDDFRSAGATEVILDLRYNGGGLVSTSAKLASLLAGRANDGKLFTRLSFNSKQAGQNSNYNFAATANGFSRVVILTGQRSCSASELVANGLKPYMQVVTIGGATCGKPFGFSPVDNCSKTISAVNFESLNASGEGRYYSGIAPTCNITDDFSKSLGDAKETLTAAALSYLQTGQCPLNTAQVKALAQTSQALQDGLKPAAHIIEPGEFRGMRAD